MSLTCSKCQYKRPSTTKTPGPECPICHTPYSANDLRPPSVEKDIDNLGPKSKIALIAFIIAAATGLLMLNNKYSPGKGATTSPVNEYAKEQASDASILAATPWADTYHEGIALALGRNKIRGCGQFAYKLMPGTASEYLVACIGMKGEKTGYLVFPDIGSVVGPIDLSK